MPRSSTHSYRNRARDRGQTEPLAALIAVVTVCVALTLYAGYVTEAVPGSSDRAVEDPALERVWHALEENGVYDPAESPNAADVGSEARPEGYAVQIDVTTISADGRVEVVDDARFESGGGLVSSPEPPPDDAKAASRPIAVKFADGDVRGGTLRVAVW